LYQNNKMENLFVEYKENKWYMFPLFLILMIGTFGFAWFFLYDDFHERKYMVNRRRLIKAIKNGEVTLVKRLPADPDYFFDIDMFDVIDQKGGVYSLWLWTRTDGVVKATVSDYIGLFTGSLSAKILNNKLVKTVKANINE
jgi:hypothetical protein